MTRKAYLVLAAAASIMALLLTPSSAKAQWQTSESGNFLAGMAAMEKRDYDRASEFLSDILDSGTEDPELQFRSLIAYVAAGQMEAARTLAPVVLEKIGNHQVPLLVLATTAMLEGDYNAAEEYVLDLGPRGVEGILGPVLNAWIKTADGRVDEAVIVLDPLAGESGLESIIAIQRALMMDVAGRLDEAAPYYDAVITDSGAMSFRMTMTVANYYERAGQPEKAVALYQDFLARSPGFEPIEGLLAANQSGEMPEPVMKNALDGAAEVLFDVGSLLAAEEGSDTSLVYARLALSLSPGFEEAKILVGEVLQDFQRHQEAIDVYRQIPEDSRFSWTVKLRIVDELASMDRVEDALAELDKLKTLRPDAYEPYMRRGNLLRSQERFAEAATAYEGAVERIPEIKPAHWLLLYFRGIAYERSDRWDEAEADFLQALELRPEQPYVLNYLAYSWVEQQINLNRAEEMLVRAVELEPDDGYIVDSLGWVYYRLGRFEEAVEQLERAVELKPADPTINDHLGDAYWRVGRKREAVVQWKRALSFDPEEDVIAIIEEKVESRDPPVAAAEALGEEPREELENEPEARPDSGSDDGNDI